MQQTLQHQGRFSAAAPGKLLVNQAGAGAGGAMMGGRMMAGGGMGSSLTYGLEDLRKTAGAGFKTALLGAARAAVVCFH